MNKLKQKIDWANIDTIIDSEKEKAEKWFEKTFNQPRTNIDEMLSNEFDIMKYPKFKQNFNLKNFLFSIEKNKIRTKIRILGIRFSFKRK